MLDTRPPGLRSTGRVRPPTIEAVTQEAPLAAGKARRLVHIVYRFPLPAVTLILLLSAGLLWVAGLRQYASWPLLAAIVIGGVQLAWDTIRQLMRHDLSVDLIALLATRGQRCWASTWQARLW